MVSLQVYLLPSIISDMLKPVTLRAVAVGREAFMCYVIWAGPKTRHAYAVPVRDILVELHEFPVWIESTNKVPDWLYTSWARLTGYWRDVHMELMTYCPPVHGSGAVRMSYFTRALALICYRLRRCNLGEAVLEVRCF